MSADFSFLRQAHIELTDIEWCEDDLGDYWRGRYTDKKTGNSGLTGSYYTICNDGLRPSKKRQQAELKALGVEKEEV